MAFLLYLLEFTDLTFFFPQIMALILLAIGKYDKRVNIIVLMSLSSIFFEWVSTTMAQHQIHNLFLSHLSDCSDALFFVLFFQSNVIVKKARNVSFFIVDILVGCCFAGAFVSGLENPPVLADAIIHPSIMMMVLYYFYEIFKYEHIEQLSSSPDFWVSSMYLLYFAGTYAYYLCGNLELSGKISSKIAMINLIMLIIFNLVFTLAIWLGRKRTISN